MAAITSGKSQVMRYSNGDVVYNHTTCFTDANARNCQCPEESPTFLEQTCSCISDSTLKTRKTSNFQFCKNFIKYLFIIFNFTECNGNILPSEVLLANVSSQVLQFCSQRTDNKTVVCDSILNITAIPEQQLLCNFTLKSNNSIQVVYMYNYAKVTLLYCIK